MKKGFNVSVLFIIIIMLNINTSCNSLETKANNYPALQQRKDTSDQANFKTLEQLYTKYVKSIEKDSNDDLSKLKLVEIYINESRVTGNLSYYNNASVKVLNSIIDKKNVTPDNLYKALTYKATVLLSLHQFAEAKKIAQQALILNAFDADIYGALVDANVELGNYKEAVLMCDKMMSIRPDIRSYSRASYIRQLFGDNDGAKKAMRLAVESGAQGLENTEWARVQLGDLYLNTGHIDTAKMLYESALFARPNYPYASMGMARAFDAEKNYTEAIKSCENAIRMMSESSFVSYLGELYLHKGDVAKAKEVHQDVLELVLEGEKENQKEPLIKHNGNREMAQAYLHTNQLTEALKYAKQDLTLRPENMDANELVAWISYLQKDFMSAKKHIDLAMKNKSSNANLLFKASKIYEAVAQNDKAMALKSQALVINPTLASTSF